ncbi:MAG TPA: hypothetical protein VFH16_15250 [Rubrobacter sp.]|jgi:hypothetical protein|nr:hypothetical protein [Rubrobacter sp.]
MVIEEEHREGWIEAPPTEVTGALLKNPPRELGWTRGQKMS